MNYLETGIILYLIVSLCSFFMAKKLPKVFVWLGLTLFILHLVLGGIRWQMGGSYFVAIIVLLAQFTGWKTKKWLRISGAFLGLLLVVVATFITWNLPVFALPEPTGPYAVGSQWVHVSDTSRLEEITSDPTDTRELMVKVWYPATVPKGQPEPYLTEAERIGFAIKYGLPPSLFNYLDQVKTHSYPGASISSGSFPVLIFLPGYYTPASGYYALLEELASHGYVVFNINPTYQTMAGEFPDGRRVYFDNEYAQSNAWSDEMGQAVDAFAKTNSKEERFRLAQRMVEVYQGSVDTKRWAADISSVLDYITNPQDDQLDFLKSQLNLNKIAAFGHSLGGSAALQALLEEPRLKAGVNLDGSQWGEVIHQAFDRPALYLSSDWPDNHQDINPYVFSHDYPKPFHYVKLIEAGHSNYSDIPLMIRLSMLNQAGNINARAALSATNELLLSFFDFHLKGEGQGVKQHAKQEDKLEVTALWRRPKINANQAPSTLGSGQ